MDRPGGTVLEIRKMVGAGPAIQRPSVMRRRNVSIRAIIVAAASLVLVTAATILWIRSYWLSDTYGLSRLAMVFTDRGELVSFIAEPDANFEMDMGYSREELPDRDETYNPRRVADRTWNVLVAHGEKFPGLRINVIRLWVVVVLMASPLALLFAGLARRRLRVRRGLCPQCGYNLRATPDRCPECGTVPEPPHNPPMQRTATASRGVVK